MKFSWKRKGGYECSSAGDKRFSAFYARLSDGRTIEEHYQCDIKGFDIGGIDWKLGKGKEPLVEISKEELWLSYLSLWIEYFKLNPELIAEVKLLAMRNFGVLSDRFANSEINQARAISEILNKVLTYSKSNV